MIGTLRRLFVVSHILPLLLIVPAMGIALVYVLETGVLLPTLTTDLHGEALLVAELAQQEPGMWRSAADSEAFVTRVSQNVTARIMVLDNAGRLLASSDSVDAGQVGQPLAHPDLASVLAGQTSVHTDYSRNLHGQVADVFVPVLSSNQSVIGVIRVSQRFATIQERFIRLRYLVFAVLVAGLLLGTTMSLLLAANLERPLREVTRAIQDLASGQKSTTIDERGPLEIRRLLRAVNTLVDRLNALERSERQMLANVVHELGRPIAGLRSAVQALARGATEDAALREELLAGMDDELERQQHLLDDLARVHDQVLGLLKVDRRPIEPGVWLPRVLVPWREAAQSKGLAWTTNVPTEWPAFEADPDRLAGAIGNLLSNAIKYTPRGGSVSVDAGLDQDGLWIRVADSGPGIPVEEQGRVFTPFYRGSTSGRFPDGMGLGLSLARDMIVAHGGTLVMDSVPGSGSRFTIRLPLLPRTVPLPGSDLP